MGSGSWFKAGAALLVSAYAGLWWFDHRHFEDGGRAAIVATHRDQVRRADRINGLILGGSNAVFGLSAGQLALVRQERWYNASLLNEGYSWGNYSGFVADLARWTDPSAVKIVVYSTIYGLRAENRDNSARTSADLVGRQRVSARTHRSALSYAQALVQTGSLAGHRRAYPVPTTDGDFDFTSYGCKFDGRPVEFNIQDTELTIRDLVKRSGVILSLFPAATLVVVVPSEFIRAPHPEREAHQRAIAVGFARSIADAGLRHRVRLVVQKPFENASLVCDAPHHASVEGRRWRTQALSEVLD